MVGGSVGVPLTLLLGPRFRYEGGSKMTGTEPN